MKRWPEDVKARAMELYIEHGPEFAASETGVPAATVRCWASRSGASTKRRATGAAHVEAAALRWAERRGQLLEEMGRVAEKALAKAEAALDRGDARPAVNLVTAMAILVDKAQLLSGDATSRHEIADPRRRLAALKDELAERRNRATA